MQFRTQRGNLLTLCERKTRFTFTAPLPSKQAETTNDALREILGPLPEPARRSVTFDNGSEFALHENLDFGAPIPLGSAAPLKTPTASSA